MNTQKLSKLAFIGTSVDAGPAAYVAADVKHARAGSVRGGTVIILGNYRATLTTARQLASRDCKVILGTEPGTSCAEYSRFVDEVWRCPSFSVAAPQDFLNALRALLPRLARPVTIMPVIERPLNLISMLEDELSDDVRLALPEARILSILHDKYKSLVAATEAGVAVPPFGIARSLDELCARIAEIGSPVVIRTMMAGCRIKGLKAYTLYGEADARAVFDGTEEFPALLVQRRFVGRRTNVYFAANDGEVVAEQHSISLRTDRLDGTGQTIEGITVAPIKEISEETRLLVRHLRYTGVGCAQFLQDEAQRKQCFLEINARFGASYAFVERTGMGLTELALDLAWNDPRRVADTSHRFDSGTRFVWTLGDFSGLLFGIRRGEFKLADALQWFGRSLIAAVRSRAHVTWSLRDPMPTIILYGRSIGSNLGLRKKGRTKQPTPAD